MRCSTACLLLLLTIPTQTYAGSDGPTHGLDPRCVADELRIFELIEKYEQTELSGSEALISAAEQLEIANSLCAHGSIKEALVFYETTHNHLVRDFGGLDVFVKSK